MKTNKEIAKKAPKNLVDICRIQWAKRQEIFQMTRIGANRIYINKLRAKRDTNKYTYIYISEYTDIPLISANVQRSEI